MSVLGQSLFAAGSPLAFLYALHAFSKAPDRGCACAVMSVAGLCLLVWCLISLASELGLLILGLGALWAFYPWEATDWNEQDNPLPTFWPRAQPLRQLGTLKGTIRYSAPDFQVPLKGFKEYLE